MKLSTLGAVTTALAISAVAGAQARTDSQVGVGVRIGVLFPTDTTTNDQVGTGLITFGADYRLDLKTPRLLGLESNLALSLDYFRRDDYGNIPVTLNYVARTGRYFFTLGAGVGFESLPDKDVAGFAYSASIGYDIPSSSTLPIFVQAKFLGADRSKVDGVGLYVGVRF